MPGFKSNRVSLLRKSNITFRAIKKYYIVRSEIFHFCALFVKYGDIHKRCQSVQNTIPTSFQRFAYSFGKHRKKSVRKRKRGLFLLDKDGIKRLYVTCNSTPAVFI